MNNALLASLPAIALGAALACSGCVVEGGAVVTSGVAVSGPPPAPMNESRPAPPTGRVVWIQGYWHWTGMQYTWIPGHWEESRPGVVWRAPRYSTREGVYFYEPGGWSAPAPPPPR
jgi:hypothetical protein